MHLNFILEIEECVLKSVYHPERKKDDGRFTGVLVLRCAAMRV